MPGVRKCCARPFPTPTISTSPAFCQSSPFYHRDLSLNLPLPSPSTRRSKLHALDASLILFVALGALDNLKAKLKAAFSKKNKKAQAEETKPTATTSAATTEPTKTEAAPAAAPATAPAGK